MSVAVATGTVSGHRQLSTSVDAPLLVCVGPRSRRSPAPSEQPVTQVTALGGVLAELSDELDHLGIKRSQVWGMRQAVGANAENEIQQPIDKVIGGVTRRWG